jgi:nucleoid DNA-binding protein
MKKDAITRRLAKDAHLSQSAAADLVDGAVAELVRELRKGQPVKVPGLGTIRPWKAPAEARDGRSGGRR